MFKTYLKIFVRQANKHRTYFLINMVGLSVALTACLLISSFVSHELSYDRAYANAERLYRVAIHMDSPTTGSFESGATSAPLAPVLKENVSAIEEVARLGVRSTVLGRGELRFQEAGLGFADNAIFKLFDWRWISGNPETALVDTSSIVLTESMARKYFGAANPLGESLVTENKVSLLVTGVIQDLPANTHFDFSALVSLQQLDALVPGGILENPNTSFTSTYVRLAPGVKPAAVEALLPNVLALFPPPGGDISTELKLRPISSIHLQPERNDVASGNLRTVAVFGITALCILLIAVVNFVNLAISRYATRAREVGLRKATGASKMQLMLQFTGEAVAFSVGGMLLALAATEQLMPLLEALTGKSIPFTYLSGGGSLLAIIALAVLLGLVAGFYPAWYFSSVQPREALGGKLATGKPATRLRNALVLFQFASAITIIVVTVVIHLQLKHVDSIELGYQPEALVVMNVPPNWNARYASLWEPFKAALLADPGIEGVTHSMQDFLQIGATISRFRSAIDADFRRIPIIPIGHDFFSTFEVELLAGRDFSLAIPTDGVIPRDPAIPRPGNTYILNELAAAEFGWTPEEAVGRQIYNDNDVAYTVIGVVGNTLKSSRDLRSPVVYVGSGGIYSFGGKIILRVAAGNQQRGLEHIDRTWNEFFPEQPVSRTFLQDQVDALYRYENQQARLFSNFALLSIVLACMGLLGLAAFNAEMRTREVGVRKVLGGSVWSIVLLLTNDFSKLVLFSNLIAWPVAYFAMARWLENFAYRIDLTPLIFIGSGLIALCIAWVTVGGTAAKAAAQKPVLALRYE